MSSAVTEAETVITLVLSEGGTRGSGSSSSRRSGRSRRSGAWGRSRSLGSVGITGNSSDKALVSAFFDADVSILTPSGSPRVLNNPVGSGVLEVHTNEEDTMVNLSRNAVGHDTTSVGLPRGGIDGDGDGADSGKSGSHVSFSVTNIGVASDLGAFGLAGTLASGNLTVTRDVRVVGFTSDPAVPFGDDGGPGVVHEATVAAVILLVTRDEFLFRESDEVVAGEEPLAFNTTSGREGPARAALTLVLDVGDGTLLTPIDFFDLGGAEGLLFSEAVALSFFLVVIVGVVVDLEFFSGEVREFIVTELGKRVLGGHLVSSLHVLVVDLFTLGIFIRSEGLVVEGLVFRPSGMSKSHLDGHSKSDNDGSEASVENLHYFCFFRGFFYFKKYKKGKSFVRK